MEGFEECYGFDIFVEFILDFIDRNNSRLFFIYYLMVLVYELFVLMLDLLEWVLEEMCGKKDKKYFRDMMVYMDKIVGLIEEKFVEYSLVKNILFIFIVDNGMYFFIII